MAENAVEIGALAEISGGYRAILCDVWGVIHNGVAAFPDAVEALRAARAQGLAVVLITNAPRPRADVAGFLDALSVPADAYDAIVTSGDVTRALIADGPRHVYHLGPDRDLSIYDGLDVELVEEREARAVVCTGLFDDDAETPQDYLDQLRRFRMRDLPFICANPDIVVERGDRLIWCAGALAREYGGLGGRTLIAGKPYRPIYQAALAIAGESLGTQIDVSDALAIGDGVLTDVKGAVDAGIDALYITGGIHAREYGDGDTIDPVGLAGFLRQHGFSPRGTMRRLA